MAHFGYQILPCLLQDWCEGYNMTGSRVGIISGMRRIHEMQTVTGLELMDVVKKGEKRVGMEEEEKTPKTNNTREQKTIPQVDQARTGNGMEEMKDMLQKIEEKIMGRMNSVEEKIESLMKRMEPKWVVRGEDIDPERSDRPDAKRFWEMLQKASEDMDSKLREIHDTRNNGKRECRQ